MKKQHLLLLITMSSLIFSCNDSENEKKDTDTKSENTISKTTLNELMQEYHILKDSADVHWTILDSINDEMVITLNRLLDEISYNSKHDATKLKELRAQVEELKSSKLKQVQLAQKDMIDIYDEKVTLTAEKVIAMAEDTPDMLDKYPLSNSLINDINELNNNSIAVKRSDYDDHAFYFNQFVKKSGKQLEGTNLDLTPYPTFSEIIIEEQEDSTKDIWQEDSTESVESTPTNIEM